MFGYLLAVAAACANATANVLQRKANRDEPGDLSMSPRLMIDLVRRPVWLAGLGAVVVSFLLLAAALGMGRLAAVQPIVVLELPLTLVGAARVFGSDLGWREWVPAGAMTAGLAGFIALLDPVGGNHGRADGLTWVLGTGMSVAVIGTVVAAGLIGSPPRGRARRPALLGVAAGMTFGLTAAFMKGMTSAFDHGVGGVLASWQTYALAGSGLAGMFLMQNALHAGRLLVAQPGITLADPAVAIVWGVLVFHERPRGGVALGLAVVCAVVIAAATLALARSPLLDQDQSADEGHSTDDSAEVDGAAGAGPQPRVPAS